MSTNSVVALPTRDGQGFRGRYVHWDGYPEGVGQAVTDIVKRDGYGQAVQTLIVDHAEWSQVTGDRPTASNIFNDVEVSGYGLAYKNSQDRWYTDQDNDGPAEWAYVIMETAVLVWHKPVMDPVWRRLPDRDFPI